MSAGSMGLREDLKQNGAHQLGNLLSERNGLRRIAHDEMKMPALWWFYSDKIYDGEVVIARTHAVFMWVNLITLNIRVANCISYNSVKFCHAFFAFVSATYRYRGTFPLDYMKFRASY
jgi:hypothetical protein